MCSHFTCNRRSFLKRLGVVSLPLMAPVLASCSHKKFFNPDEDIVLAGSRGRDTGSTRFALVVVNLLQKKKRKIDLPFLPHGVLIHPADKYRVFCIGRDSTQASLVDLRSGQVTYSLQRDPAFLFSGHACISTDRTRLYTLEQQVDNRQGSLAIRSLDSGRIVDRLPTLGLVPGGSQMLADGTLVVSHRGVDATAFHRPSLVFIDMRSRKLVRRIRPDDATLDCGHFRITGNGQIVVSAGPAGDGDTQAEHGSLLFGDTGQSTLQSVVEPPVVLERLQGRAGNICIDESRQQVAVVHPDDDLLTLWSLAGARLIKAVGIRQPHCITQSLDKRHFILGYGRNASLIRLDAATLTPQKESLIDATRTNGEHLLNWSAAIRRIMPTRVYD